MRGRNRFDKNKKMKKDLLVCIAHHYSSARFEYLCEVLDNFAEKYNCSLDIIIDTNSDELEKELLPIRNIKIVTHTGLEHPFHLTWMHRKHIKDNIDNYEIFLYVEDDVLVPYENYLNYLENFKLLWPKYVPSFIRVEEKEDGQYVGDVHEKQYLNIINVGDKQFNAFPFPFNYHAFWIMPQKELKEVMDDGFVMLSDGREFAASFVAWHLGKPALVEIEDNQVSKKCYSYHLPNNAPFVNLKLNEIFL